MNPHAQASILDLPNQTLSPDLWQQEPGAFPRMQPALRKLILEKIHELLQEFGMPEAYAVHVYGGAASYQWHPGSDVDVSVYSEWNPATLKNAETITKAFKAVEIPFKGFKIHMYLKPSDQKTPIEVADSYYDVLHDSWVVAPLELPPNFDPEVAFAPLMKAAEKKAEKFDLALGLLRRSILNFQKTQEQLPTVRDPEVATKRLDVLRGEIHDLMKALARDYEALRKSREVLHTKLRLRPENREARFAEAEVVWKFLDRYGYNDVLHLIQKYLDSGEFKTDFA